MLSITSVLASSYASMVVVHDPDLAFFGTPDQSRFQRFISHNSFVTSRDNDTVAEQNRRSPDYSFCHFLRFEEAFIVTFFDVTFLAVTFFDVAFFDVAFFDVSFFDDVFFDDLANFFDDFFASAGTCPLVFVRGGVSVFLAGFLVPFLEERLPGAILRSPPAVDASVFFRSSAFVCASAVSAATRSA